MVFVLTSVANDRGARQFTFEVAGTRPVRTKVVVAVDLELARRYKIPLQELPLLCLHLLEGRAVAPEAPISFSERDMIDYADRCAEAKSVAQRKRLGHRTPRSAALGQAWRGAGR